MSAWKQNFEAQQPLPRIQECLRVAESINTEAFAPEHLVSYARLLKVLKALEARIATLDPELFAANTWGNFGGWLVNLLKYLQDFNQGRNPAFLQHANTTADEMLTVLRPLDSAPHNNHIRATSEAADTFQRKIVEELDRVQRQAAVAKEKLNSLASEIAHGKTTLEANNQVIEQQKGRLDQSIADYQRQFSQAETNRRTEFSNAMRTLSEGVTNQTKTFVAQFTAATAASKSEHEKAIQELQKSNNEHLKFLKKRESEVNEIFGAIGASSLSGHFKTTADNDAKAANWLRWLALALMTTMIGIAGFAFYHSLNHPEQDWKVFAFRLGTSIIIFIPAIYAAQESAKHRERERQNRKLHLELASIDAYLVLLPEAKRHELKEKLTEKFFGRPDAVDKSDDVSKHALFELISSVVKNLTKPK